MPVKRKVLIVINPRAGNFNHVKALKYVEDQLAGANIQHDCFFTELRGKGLLSEALQSGGYNEILVLGGDGTLNYAVNEMGQDQLPLGIVGTGTGNDSVRSLHGVAGFRQQVKIAVNGELRSFDLGCCNGRYFVNGLGLGFDGQVVLEMQRKSKKGRNRMDYLKTVLRTLYRFKEKEVVFSLDGEEFKKKVLLLTI
ncbi:MAG: hypothetical protein JRE18_00125 [Deltaproteobacteria bacterium]|nr:hypothetical protein [Deltaproteobacteria bacterium]